MDGRVCVLLGEWKCPEDGNWRFAVRKGHMARCLCLESGTTFAELQRQVVTVFGFCLSKEMADLSFWYPGETPVFTQGKMPPVAITSDVELMEFRRKNIEYGGLIMYATLRSLEAEVSEDKQDGGGRNESEAGNVESETLASLDDGTFLAYVEEVEAGVHKKNVAVDNNVVSLVDNSGMFMETGLVDVEIGCSKDGELACGVEADAVHWGNELDERSGCYAVGNEAQEVRPDLVDSDVVCSKGNRPEVGSMIDDATLLAYVEEAEAIHKYKRFGDICSGHPDIGGLVDIQVGVVDIRGDEVVDKGKRLRDVASDDERVNKLAKNRLADVDNGVFGNSGDGGKMALIETGMVNDEGNEEEEDDYNFEEWGERINREYPTDWDPYIVVDRTYSEKTKDSMGREFVDNCVLEIGEPSNTRTMEPIGFSLGIDGECFHKEKGDDLVSVQEGIVSSEVAVERMAIGTMVIDENDPLLLRDAAPVHDNLRGPPADERNMDLRLGSEDSMYVGRIFADKQEMRDTLSVYAMKRLFSFRVQKSDKGRVIAICIDKKCSWRIYATNHEDSANVEIRTMQLTHTCDVGARSRYGEKTTAKILAKLLQSKFANGKKGPRACELPDIVLAELNVTISYMKAWNAKELAMSAARGNEEESYGFLATYLHLLKSTNPGTIGEMHTTLNKKGDTLFKYLFLAFGASIAGYQYLRKVIVIDGTALKGKYKGCLVAASGQDGNMQIYPLAFGVVDSENEGGWVWFFENLTAFVPDSEDLVFVSDRHVSIYAALRKVYPRAHHGACSVHLFRNVKHKFHNEGLAGVVVKASRAYTVGDFRYWWTEIEKRKPKCAAYLLKIGLEHWTLSHFPGMRYNIMSSNISESLNAAIQKAVDYPIVSMVEFIRAMMMRWFCCRRIEAAKAKTRCTPEIEDLLVEHLKDATSCGVISASEWIYQVNDRYGCVFTVDLKERTCTCRVFQTLLVPCCHALAARGVRNIDIYSLVGRCYFVGPWRKKYEGVIMPVPKESDTVVPEVVTAVPANPPETRRGGGRPRKVRIPSQGEHNNANKKVSKCGRCSGVGHNRKTCSALI